MKVKVKVTAIDIAQGHRECANTCPIAHALHRALPGHSAWSVDGLSAEADDGTYASLPHEAHSFVWAFDHGRHVQPFEFEAEVLNP